MGKVKSDGERNKKKEDGGQKCRGFRHLSTFPTRPKGTFARGSDAVGERAMRCQAARRPQPCNWWRVARRRRMRSPLFPHSEAGDARFAEDSFPFSPSSAGRAAFWNQHPKAKENPTRQGWIRGQKGAWLPTDAQPPGSFQFAISCPHGPEGFRVFAARQSDFPENHSQRIFALQGSTLTTTEILCLA